MTATMTGVTAPYDDDDDGTNERIRTTTTQASKRGSVRESSSPLSFFLRHSRSPGSSHCHVVLLLRRDVVIIH